MSCSENRKHQKALQGDWKGVESGEFEFYAHVSGDSILLNDFYFQKFKVYDDSIVVLLDQPRRSRIKHNIVEEQVFYIKAVTESKIELETIFEKRQRRINEFKLDTIQIKLARFKPSQNMPKLVRIEFASGKCSNQSCPQENIIIDSDGYYYYEPILDVNVDTTYESRNAKKLFDEIALIVSSLSLDSLKSIDGIYPHEQVLNTKLFFDNDTEISVFSDYTTSLFPVHLKLIHSFSFVDGLSETSPVYFAIRDTLNNYPY